MALETRLARRTYAQSLEEAIAKAPAHRPTMRFIGSSNPTESTGYVFLQFPHHEAVQREIHARIEKQRKDTGKVRALILKGRQMGCSTLIEGRFYWKVTHRQGVRSYILTHEQQATDNLFDMATRFHQHCPPEVKPSTGASNAKELAFDLLDSGYRVGTASTKETGRSSTLQFFHGSEVGYWPHADTHMSGVLQAVPDSPDTEIILESTANGIGGLFHAMWQEAEANQGSFIAIFVPWFHQLEYRKDVPEGFTLEIDEAASSRSSVIFARRQTICSGSNPCCSWYSVFS